MIPARPSLLHKKFWGWYFRRRLRKFFYRCRISGEEHLAAWAKKTTASVGDEQSLPLIVYCSHGGWWDAILAIHLSLNEYGFDAYGIMEEKQLAKYTFFSRIGMFSIVRDDARAAMQSLRYGAELLAEPRRVLWIFPQGEIRHQDLRPLEFYPGIGILVKMIGKVALAPAAFRYDFLQEEHPEVLVRIGEPRVFDWEQWKDVHAITAQCESTMTAMMESMKDEVLHGNTQGYRSFVQGKTSVEKSYDNIFRK